jgi:hypothetical protein
MLLFGFEEMRHAIYADKKTAYRYYDVLFRSVTLKILCVSNSTHLQGITVSNFRMIKNMG